MREKEGAVNKLGATAYLLAMVGGLIGVLSSPNHLQALAIGLVGASVLLSGIYMESRQDGFKPQNVAFAYGLVALWLAAPFAVRLFLAR